MHYRMITAVSVMTLALSAGACSREPPVGTARSRPPRGMSTARPHFRKQRERGSVENGRTRSPRWSATTRRSVPAPPSGTSGKKTTAQSSRRSEERHGRRERGRQQSPDHDRRRIGGTGTNRRSRPRSVRWRRTSTASPARQPCRAGRPIRLRATDASGQPVSTAPFTSQKRQVRRPTCVPAWMRWARRSTPPRPPVHARPSATICRLAWTSSPETWKRLGSASADDWWDLSKARVDEYIDRVERSVARFDDDKR